MKSNNKASARGLEQGCFAELNEQTQTHLCFLYGLGTAKYSRSYSVFGSNGGKWVALGTTGAMSL